MQATKAALRSLGGKALAERVLAGTVAPDDPEVMKLQHQVQSDSERSKRKLAPVVHVLRVVPWLLSGVVVLLGLSLVLANTRYRTLP